MYKVIWLTGLSGSGKTTFARHLSKYLDIYIIDGDELRKTICSDLGFSMKDRKENIRRASTLAKDKAKDSLVICSLISPLEEHRHLAKRIIGEENFIEVFIKTSLTECIKRDPKGLYKKALAKEIKDFTGIDSKYEIPINPNLVLDTKMLTLEAMKNKILKEIE